MSKALKRGRRRGQLVFAVLLLAAAIAAGTAGSARVGAAHAGAANTVPMGLERAVNSLGDRAYAGNYGGMEVINNQTQLVVYLHRSTSAIEHAFEHGAPAGMLVFRSTQNSLKKIDAIHGQLESEWQSLISQGINVQRFGPNPTLGMEDVGVENLTASDTQKLEALFGHGTLHIYNMTPAQAHAMRLTSRTRQNDVAPYNGGDDIADSAHIHGCTSGFGVMIGGNPRLLSAGHCFDTGTSVVNWPESNNAMGSVTNNGLGQFRGDNNPNYLDSLVFTGCNGSGTCGGDGLLWTGALGSPAIANVSGTASWAKGDGMCESGSYGGEQCDFSVQTVDTCANAFDETGREWHFCHVTLVNVTGSNNAIQGDSGGPWFKFSGSNLEIAGTGTAAGGGQAMFTGVHDTLGHWNACLITVGFGCQT